MQIYCTEHGVSSFKEYLLIKLTSQPAAKEEVPVAKNIIAGCDQMSELVKTERQIQSVCVFRPKDFCVTYDFSLSVSL